MAKTLKDVINDIDEVKKSMAEKTAHKDESDVKAQEEATKSEKEEKHVKDMNISNDNEEATKKLKKADDEDSDDDVQESATKSDKGEKCDTESVKNTDGKAEAARAKHAKELSDVDDPKGHEQASKSIDAQQALDALSKAVDTMAELQKSYIKLSESMVEKSMAKSDDVKPEGEEDCDTDDKSKKSEDEAEEKSKCGGAVSEEKKAKKSEDDSEPDDVEDEKSTKKSVELTDDKVEKSVPEGKAIANPESVEEEADKAEKSALKMGEFKRVIRKSISNIQGVEDTMSLNTEKSLKSLYGRVRDLNDDEVVSDDLVEEYNRI